MDGGAQYNPRTVEEVFRDLKGRRAGMIKALTTGTALSLSLSLSLNSLFGFLCRIVSYVTSVCGGFSFFFFFGRCRRILSAV
jgi:hypothetical protein